MSLHDAVARAIDFTEDRLDQPVTVGAMADAAGYSLFHFCRVFGRCTRGSPYTYLIRRRLTVAVGDVVCSSRRIVDVALGLGFESHEGFTRAFTRLYGVTPSQARARGDVAASRLLPRLTVAHLVCLERHGLRPEWCGTDFPSPDPAGGVVARVPVPLRWPERSGVPDRPDAPDVPGRPDGPDRPGLPGLPDRPDRPDRPSDDARRTPEVVAFSLVAPEPEELPLVLDWLLHGWQVASGLDLALPEVQVDRSDGVRVLVPVREC